MKKIFFIIVVLISGTAFSQQKCVPGRVLIRIKPQAVSSFRSAFADAKISESHFDPQKFCISDLDRIHTALGKQPRLRITSIKPLIPQHNVVLENLRERTNPELFFPTNTAFKSSNLDARRNAEEKISRWFEIFYDGNESPETACAELKRLSIIEFAEPRYLNNLLYIPNDTYLSEQYAITQMRTTAAWDIVRCDSTMLVADDDIGADWHHPDLANTVYVNTGETGLDADGFDKRSNGIDDDGDGFVDDWHGWDFAGNYGEAPDNDPMPGASHGTHTSGIMAASGNNKTGICGVAFGAKLLIIKCSGDGGNDVAFGYEGIVYAADRGAKLVNNSWGGTGKTQSGEDIITYAISKNCVVVASAGNNGGSVEDVYHVIEYLYPSAFQHVLSVGSTDNGGAISYFSEYNDRVDVNAPGGNIFSTTPYNSYGLMSGTSQAAPNASGGIALIRQKFPDLTPDQAIQRLRATCDPLTTAQDRHPGLTGKGAVNIFRAVSESTAYSARIESVEINDGANGSLESGETAAIILNVRNYLSPLTNLKATVQFLNDTGSFLSLPPYTITFGKANTLSLVQNFSGSFMVNVSRNTPSNYTVKVKLHFLSTKENYGPDPDYFTLVINKGYLDLNKNNVTVTFDAKANIGYSDPPNNTAGLGFLWTKAPASIGFGARDVLSAGGLMIAADAGRLVSASRGSLNDALADQDFSPVSPIRELAVSDHPNAAQQLQSIYDDANAPESIQVGVTVTQNAYAFTEGLSANAIVLDYTIRKRLPIAGTVLSAGIFADWDIGPSGSLNIASHSPYDSLIAVTRRYDDNYPFIGMKLISAIPNDATINIYSLNNDGSDGSAATYGGFTKDAKWLTLNASRDSAGIGDVSVIYGLRQFDMSTLDSIHLTYVIGFAENDALLKSTIDETAKQWHLPSAVTIPTQQTDELQVSPNPFADHLRIAWTNLSEVRHATIEITDLLGRVVFSITSPNSQLDLYNLNLPSGSYFITLNQGEHLVRRRIVRM
ncbi:MAG: S8 family serine peptidase [bacterium]